MNSNEKPCLLVMAAGMGSRYGGLKQIDKMTPEGEILLDFSLYDAFMAGFDDVIFVIKEENETDFRNLIDDRAGRHMRVRYAYQKMDDLPEGYSSPEERKKPWGTAHAVYAARDMIKGPFAVINADDYYGEEAFYKLYDFLQDAEKKDKYGCAMVGFRVENTLTENGYVSRGICEISEDKMLQSIKERTRIKRLETGVAYTEDEGKTFTDIREGTIVSMNFWGFTSFMMDEIEAGFPEFLDRALKTDPAKAEYFLPDVVDRLIREGKARVKVMTSDDRWYGVTYAEDKETVQAALMSMKDKGIYPQILWV